MDSQGNNLEMPSSKASPFLTMYPFMTVCPECQNISEDDIITVALIKIPQNLV